MTPDGNTKMYITSADAPSLYAWEPLYVAGATGMPLCDTPPHEGGSCDTGEANTTFLDNHAVEFPAAEYCADLTAHGHNDWYLPSINELWEIYANLRDGNPPGTYGLYDVEYWSSTETAGYLAACHDFTAVYQEMACYVGDSKTVRCARK